MWTQRTRCHDIYIDRRPYVHRYCACAALRANVAGRIGNRFNPVESAFLVPSAISRSPHNAQHSLVIGRAGASPPSRTAAIIFLFTYIYIYPFVRRALNLLRASFSPIFQYFSAVNVTRVSFSPIIRYFLTCS